MEILHTDMQLDTAKYLRWLPSDVQVTESRVEFSGWALPLWDRAEDIRFLVNGRRVTDLEWPLPSPHLLDHFPNLPDAAMAHFRCRYSAEAGEALFPGGFLRLNLGGPFGEHRRSYGTAWFVGDPALETTAPTDARIARVIGVGDLASFRMGGATIVNRIDALLRDRFDRPVSDWGPILDWGCGAGRLTRYLRRFASSVTGIDIDADTIAACRDQVAGVSFHTVDLLPPTQFADAAFGLVLGMSVMTHLDAAAQDAWLHELHRLTQPGGLVLLSITGKAQLTLYRDRPDSFRATHALGLYAVKQNSQLDGVIDDATYYKDTLHTPDYIAAHWGEFFDVLDIIPAIAGNQDLVVLRRPRG